MTAHTFLVPKDHTLEDILGFSNLLAAFSDEAEGFIFDFQTVGYDTPFGMIFISFAIRKFIETRTQAKISAVSFIGQWYAGSETYR